MVESVDAHRPGQDKAPQEEHDDGVGEGGKSVSGRGDLKDSDEYRYEESSDRNGDALCYPPGNDEEKNSHEAACFSILRQDRNPIRKEEQKPAQEKTRDLPFLHDSSRRFQRILSRVKESRTHWHEQGLLIFSARFVMFLFEFCQRRAAGNLSFLGGLYFVSSEKTRNKRKRAQAAFSVGTVFFIPFNQVEGDSSCS